MNTSMDMRMVVARVRRWLAEGKDVRVFAVPRACQDFPLIELWDRQNVELITRNGIVREENRGLK